MENTEEKILNLAGLPPDIVRLIIKMEKPEKVDRLRLISPSWKSLIDDYIDTNSQWPTIDFLCLNFVKRKAAFGEILKFEMIIIGRKSKFGEDETFTYHYLVDRQFLRILKRCSKIDTLLLNLPVSSGLPEESIDLIRAYVGNTQIFLVKISSLFAIDRVVKQIVSDLAHFNAAGHFEIEVQFIKELIFGGFIEEHLGKIQSIKCYDYTKMHLSTAYAPPGKKTWNDMCIMFNRLAGVQAEFTPRNDEYHLQVIMKKNED